MTKANNNNTNSSNSLNNNNHSGGGGGHSGSSSNMKSSLTPSIRRRRRCEKHHLELYRDQQSVVPCWDAIPAPPITPPAAFLAPGFKRPSTTTVAVKHFGRGITNCAHKAPAGRRLVVHQIRTPKHTHKHEKITRQRVWLDLHVLLA